MTSVVPTPPNVLFIPAVGLAAVPFDWIGPPGALGLAAAAEASNSVQFPSGALSQAVRQTQIFAAPSQDVRSVTLGKSRAAHQTFRVVSPPATLESELFTNRATLKVLTSRVAMHLRADERGELFAEIDRLLDLTHWEDESVQINEKAFDSYLRFTIYARPRVIPSVGVGPTGTFLAAWQGKQKSVRVEFLANDNSIAFVNSISARGSAQKVAWRGNVADLRDAIVANRAAECIDG